MKTAAYIPAIAAIAAATPLVARQAIDFDVIDAAPEPTIVTVTALAPATTVSYDLAAATAEATSGPLKVRSELEQPVKRGDCSQQLIGHGDTPDDSSADGFLAYSGFSDAAENAQTPSGYTSSFTNLQASNSAYGYLGLWFLDSYDPAVCAAKCDDMEGCSGINVYFERSPTLDPGAACPNPAPTTMIKCVLWGGYAAEENANNIGETRENFKVVIAGSNGYMKTAPPKVDGYSGVALGNAAINAPDDCNNGNTYLGARMFTTSYYNPSLCAAVCSSMDEGCTFFVTYLGALAGHPDGQYCALYKQGWDKSYATNVGQWRNDGKDWYSVDYAFAYWNNANPGFPSKPVSK